MEARWFPPGESPGEIATDKGTVEIVYWIPDLGGGQSLGQVHMNVAIEFSIIQ